MRLGLVARDGAQTSRDRVARWVAHIAAALACKDRARDGSTARDGGRHVPFSPWYQHDRTATLVRCRSDVFHAPASRRSMCSRTRRNGRTASRISSPLGLCARKRVPVGGRVDRMRQECASPAAARIRPSRALCILFAPVESQCARYWRR